MQTSQTTVTRKRKAALQAAYGTAVTRQIAFHAAFEMGREAAKRGADYFTGCPLTDHECRLRWADGFNSTREIAW